MDMSSNEIHIEVPENAKVYLTYSLLESVDGKAQWLEEEHEVNRRAFHKIRIVTVNGVKE